MEKKTGQSADRREIAFETLNKDQRAVLQTLVAAERKMKLREIQDQLNEETGGEWNSLGRAKGYSRVRNSMRRLAIGGYVYHDKKIGDGTYMSVVLKAEEVAAEEPVKSDPNPVALSEDEAIALRVDYEKANRFKRSDCSLYNACLDQAISGKWEGFACTSCTAYDAPDEFQQAMNANGLAAVRKAVEMLDKYGKISRKRGVKEGTRLKVIQDRPLVDALEL